MTDLRDFLLHRMRMSHIYQPVMLKALLQGNGRASIRAIAASFLALDEAQLEYYEEIVKRMPGPVLRRHGLVERDGDGYRLKTPLKGMTAAEKTELIKICDSKVSDYLKRRGDKAYDHRRTALGDISGTVRYEVFRRAGFRCELCGISAEEAALEVDHIIPRNHGGQDVIENLQALCWKCNANKGDRDATDFRVVREGLESRQSGCLFCELPDKRIVASNTLAIAVRDAYPVTPLHTLLVSKRHAATWFDLSDPERRGISILMDVCRRNIQDEDKTVQGFNIGMNNGEVSGQTVTHAHVHLIPRRKGDVENPRGGVRSVVSGKATY